MIIAKNEELKTNIKNSTEFGISDNSSKIFAFLSSFLYTDKHRAVLTELSSNAVDAHIESGIGDTPIKVVMPTYLKPELTIRDFGKGLIEKDVYRFLTKYGETSKDDTNEQIGGFGIGSKSPAAVTSTWTINSYHDGEMTQYLIHVNENGIPSINKLFSRKTDESGLEVIIPVKPDEINQWQFSVNKTYQFYEPLPEIINNKFPIEKIEIDYEYDEYLIGDDGVSHHCIINRRLYYLNRDTITSSLEENSKEADAVNFVLSGLVNIALKFKTGELSVSLSREDLQYDNRTINNIVQRCLLVYDAYASFWKNEVSIAKDVFDYKFKMNEFSDKYFSSWNNATYKKHFATLNGDYYPNLDYSNNKFNFTIKGGLFPKIQTQCKGRIVTMVTNSYKYNYTGNAFIDEKYNGTIGKYEYDFSFLCENPDSVLFVLRDVKNTPSRVGLYLEENNKPVFIVDEDVWNVIPDNFQKVLGSSLDKPVITREKRENIESDLYRIVGKGFQRFLEADIDKSLNIVCLKFGKMNTISSLDDNSKKFYDVFIEADCMLDCVVIAVRIKDEIPSWSKTPDEFMKDLNDELIKEKESIIAMYKHKRIENIYYGISQLIVNNKLSSLTSNPDTVYNNVVKEIKEHLNIKFDSDVYKKWKVLSVVENYMDTTKQKFKSLVTWDYEERLIEAYPMLGMINGSTYYLTTEKINNIFDYIDGCGK